jgi:hypothetical protein
VDFFCSQNSQQKSSPNIRIPILILRAQQLRLDSVSARFLRFTGIVLEDVVHLLEGAALGLGDEEEGPDEREETEDGEEDVGAVAGVFDQRRGDEALPSLA